ncbi:DNA excision repair protein ERCC-6 [Blomia tropicalis]|nr:DNA excision repair protein ERCC-6 [Blomia tropicalis]
MNQNDGNNETKQTRKNNEEMTKSDNVLQFNLNTETIRDLAVDCDNPELKSLGVTLFDSASYERGKWSKFNVLSKRQSISCKQRIEDDGDFKKYKQRLAKYRLEQIETNTSDSDEQLIQVCDQLQLPERIWNRLYEHQRECIRWLWGLHKNLCGGIMGDEMGLGKTIQVIAFLIGLKCSKYHEVCHLYSSLGPVLLICPATVMHQWVQEFQQWWPTFRVAILHNTGTYSHRDKGRLIGEIVKQNGILITTYNGICTYKEKLIRYSWHYVILDEGHKIRNPDTMATHCCKLVQTPHRLILSGSPMQNNLRELWSLFDFIYPGKLGTMSTFMDTVAHPIRIGSYANATDLQIQIAYQCTLRLRDTIKPYLLRRTKDDVKIALSLPDKKEQVLFCKLSEEQRDVYQRFLDSGIVRDIQRGRTIMFAALVKIRNICNHPFLFAPTNANEVTFDSDFFRKSGKMEVKHKVLLFTQSCQMLDLLERYAQLKEFDYLRMDGKTSISVRQSMIKEFNSDPNRFLFILSTKVGGIGVNLIGADRVIIFDPDWNPCTDIQARERCWRIGQNKDVIIYRLLCAGTVEEKIYHRQIYKQYLTNSVLNNPNHRRYFKINDLNELFELNSFNETSLMFSESKVKFKNVSRLKTKRKTSTNVLDENVGNDSKKMGKTPLKKEIKNSQNSQETPITEKIDEIVIPEISEEKRAELRERAKLLSKKIGMMYAPSGSGVDSSNQTVLSEEATISRPEKRKKRRTKEGLKFEGKRIKHLVGQEVFEQDEKQNKTKVKKNNDSKKEDYILSNLLGNTLDVVLQHDTITNVNVPDHYHLKREAERIASEAMDGLRRTHSPTNVNSTSQLFLVNHSNQSRATTSTNIDNPLSSANLLAMLRAKKTCPIVTVKKSDNNRKRYLENDEMIQELRDFIHHKASRPFESTSDEIVKHFDGRIPPEKYYIIKSMLRSLCEKVRDNSSIRWRLKDEFH